MRGRTFSFPAAFDHTTMRGRQTCLSAFGEETDTVLHAGTQTSPRERKNLESTTGKRLVRTVNTFITVFHRPVGQANIFSDRKLLSSISGQHINAIHAYLYCRSLLHE